MKKTNIVFAISFALPFGLLLISYLWYLIQISYPSSSSTPDQAFSFLYSLISLFGSYALFSYLGKTTKISVVKPVVFALLFGLLAGNIASSLFIPLYSGFSVVSYIGDFLPAHFVTALWQFFPAISALLFIELKAKEQMLP